MGWACVRTHCTNIEESKLMTKKLIFGLLITLHIGAQTDDLKKEELKKKKDERIQVAVNKNNALEFAIDPDHYYVGPGDQLLISIWGQVNESVPAIISPEGKILVRSVKDVDVRELSLTEAKKRIKDEMKNVYPNADISINLISLRSFRVNVIGAITLAGSIVVSGADRVSDAIQAAGGISDPNASSQRNIQVRRKNGSIVRVDLVKKRNIGSLDSDPFLMDGDVIYVASVESRVSIYGSVNFPGTYEFVRQETICDILELAGGIKAEADLEHAELVRLKSDTGWATEVLPISLRNVIAKRNDPSVNIPLKASDRIYVRAVPRFHLVANVEVAGEVNFPGIYPIEEEQTHLSQVVENAGGFTERVSLDKITVYRNVQLEGEDAEFERLKLVPASEQTEIESSYLKAKMRQRRIVVQTDFKKLFERGKVNSKYDILLKRGDYVDVASIKKTINIVGGVTFPGIMDWEPGKSYSHYVAKAGGFSKNAKTGDVQIIKATTQSWVDATNSTQIEDGDVVFIPEKKPFDGWKKFTETITLIGQLAAITSTIILIYFTVNPRKGN